MNEIPVAQFMSKRTADSVVIDVREQEEYDEAHIPGVVHIPLGQLPDRLDDVPRPLGEEPIYVVCRSGKRSLQGVETLAGAGMPAVSIQDGTLGWIKAGGALSTGSER